MIHISLKPEILGEILGMPITNSLVLSYVTAIVLLVGGFLLVRSMKRIPGHFQNAGEIILDGLLEFMTQVLSDRKLAYQFFPLVATFFLFILVSNWIGLLPGIGSVGFKEVSHGEEVIIPFFRAATADLNMTFALAIIGMVSIQIFGIMKLGFFAHLGKFFMFTKGPIYFFVGILELIGEFAKVLSFSFRLFGNIFAGEALLIIIMTLVPLVVPLPFFFLEIFVGFIQALVFTMLMLIFLKVATIEVEH